MDHSFTESRGGLMLTEDLVGVRLPRHLNTLIAQIPGVGAAFSVMLPIVGVVLAVEIISKLIAKHKEAAESIHKLEQAQANFGISAQEAFNKLDDKLLEAGIKADELAGNHMAALHKQLVLIDHQSMNDLKESFNSLAQEADKSLSLIQEHWYESKIGVGGVRDALQNFKTQYEELLAAHNNKGAGDLLQGTLDSAIKMKELMEAQQDGHGSTQSDLDAQKQLIALLQTELQIREKTIPVVHALKQQATDAAVKATAKQQLDFAEQYRESYGKLMETAVEWAKVTRGAHGSVGDSLKQTEDLFKTLADDQKKAAQESLQFATQSFSDQAETAKAAFGQERGAISSAAEAGLISRRQAVKEEIALIQRESGVRMVALQQEVAAKRAAIQAEIDADNLAAERTLSANGGNKADPQYLAFLNDAAVKTQQLDAVTNKYNADMSVTMTDAQTQVAGLNSHLAQLYPTWNQFFQKMRNDLPTLGQEMQSNFNKGVDAFSTGVAKTLVEGKNLGQEMRQMTQQMLESWIEYAIKRMLMDRLVTVNHITGNATQVASDKASGAISQLAAAKAGAAKAYQAMAGIPIIGPELGAIAAGAAFAAMMAFETGGEIPGSGPVPIIAHGGETVVTKQLTDQVKNSGGRNGGDMHLHATFSPHVQAMDAEGVDRVLAQHQDKFFRMAQSHMRKMNKGGR